MTKSHALLLSQPLIPPTLRHEKTVTRRTPSCTNSLVDGRRISGKAWKALELDFTRYDVGHDEYGSTWFIIWSGSEERYVDVAPIYNQGDTIWFKETWAITTNINKADNWPGRKHSLIESINNRPYSAYIWRADGPFQWLDEDGLQTDKSYWKASMFMPKAAARLWATVSAPITCERLQDITEEQAKREGVDWILDKDFNQAFKNYSPGCDTYEFESAVESFKTLWASINGWDSYAANPPVYVIPFNLIDILEVVKGDMMTQ